MFGCSPIPNNTLRRARALLRSNHNTVTFLSASCCASFSFLRVSARYLAAVS